MNADNASLQISSTWTMLATLVSLSGMVETPRLQVKKSL